MSSLHISVSSFRCKNAEYIRVLPALCDDETVRLHNDIRKYTSQANSEDENSCDYRLKILI